MALSGALQACDRFQLAPRATRRLNGHSTVAWNPLTATRKLRPRAALSQLCQGMFMPTLERRRSGGAARGATERIRPRRRVKADAPRSDAFSRARRGLAEAGGLLLLGALLLGELADQSVQAGEHVRLQRRGSRKAGRELHLQPDVLLPRGLAPGTCWRRRRRRSRHVHALLLDPQCPRRRRRRRRRRAILLVRKKGWH